MGFQTPRVEFESMPPRVSTGCFAVSPRRNGFSAREKNTDHIDRNLSVLLLNVESLESSKPGGLLTFLE